MDINQITQDFVKLCRDVEFLKEFIQKAPISQPIEPDCWLDLNELVHFDPEKRSKSTFYSYTRKNLIPFHRRGRKVIFLKSEISLWLKQGRVKTIEELSKSACEYKVRKS